MELNRQTLACMLVLTVAGCATPDESRTFAPCREDPSALVVMTDGGGWIDCRKTPDARTRRPDPVTGREQVQ